MAESTGNDKLVFKTIMLEKLDALLLVSCKLHALADKIQPPEQFSGTMLDGKGLQELERAIPTNLIVTVKKVNEVVTCLQDLTKIESQTGLTPDQIQTRGDCVTELLAAERIESGEAMIGSVSDRVVEILKVIMGHLVAVATDSPIPIWKDIYLPNNNPMDEEVAKMLIKHPRRSSLFILASLFKYVTATGSAYSIYSSKVDDMVEKASDWNKSTQETLHAATISSYARKVHKLKSAGKVDKEAVKVLVTECKKMLKDSKFPVSTELHAKMSSW